MKQARDLLSDLIKASGQGHDSRFRSWAKRITSIDYERDNGYTFVGNFVPDGTVAVDAKPGLYLVMTVTGSRKYQKRTYTVVTMDADGNLSPAGVQTTDATKGWAVRIREPIANLLAELAERPKTTTITIDADDNMVATLNVLKRHYGSANYQDTIIATLKDARERLPHE